MKTLKFAVLSLLTAVVMAAPLSGHAADKKKSEKVIPYTLDYCITDGEKLGSMGKPYVFQFEGHEVKLCCQGCVSDFKKSSAKYLKMIDEAEAKAKAKK